VRDLGTKLVVTLRAEQLVGEVREWLAAEGARQHHHGFPVLDAGGRVVGVVTRRELLDPGGDLAASVSAIVRRAALVIGPDSTLREAADIMVRERIGRLPVVDAGRLVGIVTRSDLLEAHQRRLVGEHHVERVRRLRLAESVAPGA
jgi:CBS domain-containing protein